MLDSAISIVDCVWEQEPSRVLCPRAAMPASSKPKAAGAGEPPFVSLFLFFFPLRPFLSFAGANSIFERLYLWMRKPGATRGEVSALLPARESESSQLRYERQSQYHAASIHPSIHHTLHLVLRAVVPCYCYSQLDRYLWSTYNM